MNFLFIKNGLVLTLLIPGLVVDPTLAGEWSKNSRLAQCPIAVFTSQAVPPAALAGAPKAHGLILTSAPSFEKLLPQNRSPIDLLFASFPKNTRKRFEHLRVTHKNDLNQAIAQFTRLWHHHNSPDELMKQTTLDPNLKWLYTEKSAAKFYEAVANFIETAFRALDPNALDFMETCGVLCADVYVDFNRQILRRRMPLPENLRKILSSYPEISGLPILDIASGPEAVTYLQRAADDALILTDRSAFVFWFLKRAAERLGLNRVVVRSVDVLDPGKLFLERHYKLVRLSHVLHYVDRFSPAWYASLLERIPVEGSILIAFPAGIGGEYAVTKSILSMIEKAHWSVEGGQYVDERSDGRRAYDYVVFQRKHPDASPLRLAA